MTLDKAIKFAILLIVLLAAITVGAGIMMLIGCSSRALPSPDAGEIGYGPPVPATYTEDAYVRPKVDGCVLPDGYATVETDSGFHRYCCPDCPPKDGAP